MLHGIKNIEYALIRFLLNIEELRYAIQAHIAMQSVARANSVQIPVYILVM